MAQRNMTYAPGQRVLISGLRNYDYLNGSIGTVIGIARGGRFAILVTCEETLYYDTIDVERKISVHPRNMAPAHALPCLNAFYVLIDPPCGCKTRWADVSPTPLTYDADWVTTLCCGCKIAKMYTFPELKRCKFHSSGEIFDHVYMALSSLQTYGTENPTYNPRVPHVRLRDPIDDNLSRMEDVNAPVTGLQLPLASVPPAIYPNSNPANDIPLCRSSSVPTDCSAESTTGTVPDDPSCFLDTYSSQRCSSGPVVPLDSNDHHLVSEPASVVPKRRKRRGGRKPKKNPSHHLKPPLEV